MKIRVLIVDDEPLGRERVRSMLRSEPDIEIVGESADGRQAVAAIRQHNPDLVFLDVQMPGMDGFEVLRQLHRDQMPVVIFVTAYDQHALKAFEVHALDYLLKPFKQSRFRAALQRARDLLASRRADEASKKLLALLGERPEPREFLSRIPVKTDDRTAFIRTSRIDCFESAGNYVVLHVGKETHVIRETLASLEAQLDPKKFIRVNRSTIVNVDKIKEVRPLFKGEHVILLSDGRQIPLTRGIRELEELLKFS
ncbi:MAG TPA: LytTR family DNA-binding domain-containing protein [Verrucomicrobiota bacterium]|nr:LytTR family DNA-binding domain-containing protein [Verrucomicrobiota bacterium]